MNNFHVVFTAVKEMCVDENTPSEICYALLCFKLSESKSYLSLDTYLEVLQNIGLIEFCKAKKTIKLTKKGTQVETLFDMVESDHAA